MIRALVLTSDNYLRCIPPFAYQWNKHIGARIPVVVGCYAEPDKTKLPDYFTIVSLGKQENFTWSEGLIKFIHIVNDPVYLFLLEDYFITEANVTAIDLIAEHLCRNATIGRVDLTRDVVSRSTVPWRAIGSIPTVRSIDTAHYQWSTQASVWRRDFMLEWIMPHENPWQAEKGCSKRIIAARQDERRSVPSVLGVSAPVLKYVNAVGGEGKKPGRWDRKKFPQYVWDELDKHGLL